MISSSIGLSLLYHQTISLTNADTLPFKPHRNKTSVKFDASYKTFLYSWCVWKCIQWNSMSTILFRPLGVLAVVILPWWRHQLETFPALLAICAGNSPRPVNSPHKGQWRGALMISLICVWISGWVNNGKAGDVKRYRAHYDVIVMAVIEGHIFINMNGKSSLMTSDHQR